jgi:CBS domain-containing protein
MNIAFFLTPKQEVVYEKITSTIKKALDSLETSRYTAIPLIDDRGKYVGTLTEGDLLWELKKRCLDIEALCKVKIKDISRRMVNKPVCINENMDSLIGLAISQNFVPVVDDDGVFIGIIKRSDIINYCANMLDEKIVNK